MGIRRILAVLIIAMLLPAAALCESAVTLTDMMGREITLDAPATRVVAVTASDCEILYALGAGNTLVGRGEYCNYPEDVIAVPSVESGYDTNIEQIIALEPQIVIMSTMAQSKEGVEALEAAGIKVVVNNAVDIECVYESISIIGAATGKTAEAERLVQGLREGFDEIKASAPKSSGKTVYFEVSPLVYGLWTAGGGTFMDELAGMLGLTNAFSDITGWGEISEEQVLMRDPDYIITISMYFGEGPTPVEEILAREGWRDMKAVKNGAVYQADSDMLSRPAPRLLDAALAMRDMIYGK